MLLEVRACIIMLHYVGLRMVLCSLVHTRVPRAGSYTNLTGGRAISDATSAKFL